MDLDPSGSPRSGSANLPCSAGAFSFVGTREPSTDRTFGATVSQ
jgi:hypothetical protein